MHLETGLSSRSQAFAVEDHGRLGFFFCFDCLHVFELLISRLRRQVKN